MGTNAGTITGSFAIGTIMVTDSYVGGLVGESWNNSGEIKNCYATGNVTSIKGSVGGVSVGLVDWWEITVFNPIYRIAMRQGL